MPDRLPAPWGRRYLLVAFFVLPIVAVLSLTAPAPVNGVGRLLAWAVVANHSLYLVSAAAA